MEEGGCGGLRWEEGGVVVEGLGEGWDLGGGVGVWVWGWVWGWGGGCHDGGCRFWFVVVVVVVGYVLYCIGWRSFFFCSPVGLIGVLLGLCGTVSEA